MFLVVSGNNEVADGFVVVATVKTYVSGRGSIGTTISVVTQPSNKMS